MHRLLARFQYVRGLLREVELLQEQLSQVRAIAEDRLGWLNERAIALSKAQDLCLDLTTKNTELEAQLTASRESERKTLRMWIDFVTNRNFFGELPAIERKEPEKLRGRVSASKLTMEKNREATRRLLKGERY